MIGVIFAYALRAAGESGDDVLDEGGRRSEPSVGRRPVAVPTPQTEGTPLRASARGFAVVAREEDDTQPHGDAQRRTVAARVHSIRSDPADSGIY